MSNFGEISQSPSEIKRLSEISENGGPSYWNSISGFNCDLIYVISMPFCIDLQTLILSKLNHSRRSYDAISIFHGLDRQPCWIWSM